MKHEPSGPPGYVAFYSAAYKRIGVVIRELSETPEARALPHNVMLTALACACMKSCALALAPSDVALKEIKWFGRLLLAEVKNFRDRMGERGQGTMSQ